MISKKIARVQRYLTTGLDYKRWRMWHCVEGSSGHRAVEAREEIAWLNNKGFKAKVHAPLPQHLTSGHTHIVVLATFKEKCGLLGI